MGDMRWSSWVVVGLAASGLAFGSGCSSAASPDAPSADGTMPGAPANAPPGATSDPPGAGGSEPPSVASGSCTIDVTTNAAALGMAAAAGEHALVIEASSISKTSWAEKDNEAVVLEVLRGTTRIGHIVLHQGQDRFAYGMHLGALNAGEALQVRVSPLSATKADKRACISKVTLTAVADMGNMADGIAHAPVVKWPAQKSFDDLPVLLGWSRAGKSYQLTYTNENGGTTELCGGGARGLRSEIARWSRGLDMEGVWAYGGAGRFERCTGTVPPTPGVPRMESAHPVLYYGDGHNRVFESRGGYGQECGSGSDAKPNGDLAGWNTANPGNDESKDDPFTIVLRPLPVDMDAIGVTKLGGRREGIVDTYAPWLYRLTDSEAKREGKIDGMQTFDMSRYLLVDVYAADVGGSGDSTCGPVSLTPSVTHVTGGFILRAVAKNGAVYDGPQMTADYFGGTGPAVKRIAIPLAAGVNAADITKVVFDAYDDDGIYFLGIGDAFIAKPSGTNGATLEYAHKGLKPAAVYVDDGQSGCVAGTNTKDGIAYPCVGSAYTFPL